MASRLTDKVKADRRRNLEDIIRYARWEVEIGGRLGKKCFEMRDG